MVAILKWETTDNDNNNNNKSTTIKNINQLILFQIICVFLAREHNQSH